MQVKRSVVFIFVFGLALVGIAFAFSGGPCFSGQQCGVNGVFSTTQPTGNGLFNFNDAFTCRQCHSGNALNSSTGNLTLSGLPAQWTPGTVYPLTVTVQRTGAVVYGFQLSAVVDATRAQAGTFSIPAGQGGRERTVTSGGIQYAEHILPSNTTTFPINWTAPANASVGAVRFNLAGNAANGNGSDTGDFIYTRVD